MTESTIREKYRNLLSDLDFDKIELELRAPNIFQILNITRTEIRHSNFLSWLLDPNGTHGLGKLFLIKFLRELAASDTAAHLDEFDIENLNYNNVELRREWRNIDLLIIFDTLVVCIENKIGSRDHSNQLSKYRETVDENFKTRKRFFVYLTPAGDDPNETGEDRFYTTYSYESITGQLDTVLKVHGTSLNPSVRQYISDYLTTLKRSHMKTDTINDLAVKIYNNHKELLDFVFENKPDEVQELHDILVNRIQKKETGWILGSTNKYFVRFLPDALNKIIPRKGKWTQKESFLFEMVISWEKKKVTFKATVSPGDPATREILTNALETLSDIPGYRKPKGEEWLVYFLHAWKFGDDDMTEVDEAQFLKSFEAALPAMEKIVGKVQTAILQHKTELEKHCGKTHLTP